MKTVTLLMQPAENGWMAVHKKYKNVYGRVICTEAGKTAVLKTSFGENQTVRAEAVEAAVRSVFLETEAERIQIDGETQTRAAWQAARDALYQKLHRTRADYADVLGRRVHCVMDRPLGSAHPRYPDMIYPVNYGCVPGILAGDGAEQDVYILGPTVPLETFDGTVIAVIHRFDDCEDKWVVAAEGVSYTAEEIRKAVNFQERYYTSELIL